MVEKVEAAAAILTKTMSKLLRQPQLLNFLNFST